MISWSLIDGISFKIEFSHSALSVSVRHQTSNISDYVVECNATFIILWCIVSKFSSYAHWYAANSFGKYSIGYSSANPTNSIIAR